MGLVADSNGTGVIGTFGGSDHGMDPSKMGTQMVCSRVSGNERACRIQSIGLYYYAGMITNTNFNHHVI